MLEKGVEVRVGVVELLVEKGVVVVEEWNNVVFVDS